MNASSFGTMPKLRTIRIDNNGLTDFPFDESSFIRMPMLSSINFENNEMRYIFSLLWISAEKEMALQDYAIKSDTSKS